MRRTIFCVLAVLVIGIISSHVLMAVPQEGWDEDNFGKVIGWVVDPENGQPVNEVYNVVFSECSKEKNRNKAYYETDQRGLLSIEVLPGTYCLHFYPESRISKFSFEPSPLINDKYIFQVTVEKGKITEFRKVATIGGKIKFRLLDTGGRVIKPAIEFSQDSEIYISIYSGNMEYPIAATNLSDENMSDGEMTVYALYPDKYSIRVDFRRLGFQSERLKNIQVEENKTTEVDVVIDLNDITGIEGRVFDKNGNALSKVEVSLIPSMPVTGDFSTLSDQNGNYRLTGLPEGIFHFNVVVYKAKKMFMLDNVEIKKNMIIKKDITVNWASN